MANDGSVQNHSPDSSDHTSSDHTPSGDTSRSDTTPSSPYEKMEGGSWSRAEGPFSPSDARWQRLQSLVNQLPGAVYRCTYDTSWISIFMGRGFRDICGLDPESLDPAGRSFKDVIFDDDIPKIKDAVQEAVDKQTYYSIEYRVETDDGSMKWLEDNGRPFFREDGSVKWLDGILLDITERKRVRESLQRMTDTLEETVEMRTKQVRALAAELSMVEQNERSQIARTLHDEIQQFLRRSASDQDAAKRYSETKRHQHG
jgi:PAS domain S-box-containing protein